MAEKNKGKITQVISAVLDIKFPGWKTSGYFECYHDRPWQW